MENRAQEVSTNTLIRDHAHSYSYSYVEGAPIVDEDGYVTSSQHVKLSHVKSQWIFLVFSNCATTPEECNVFTYPLHDKYNSSFCAGSIDVQYRISMWHSGQDYMYREFSAVRERFARAIPVRARRARAY